MRDHLLRETTCYERLPVTTDYLLRETTCYETTCYERQPVTRDYLLCETICLETGFAAQKGQSPTKVSNVQRMRPQLSETYDRIFPFLHMIHTDKLPALC